MDSTQILNLLVNAPLTLVVFWMLTKEQSAHATTRLALAECQKQREQDNRQWALLLVEVVMGKRDVLPSPDPDNLILTRLRDL